MISWRCRLHRANQSHQEVLTIIIILNQSCEVNVEDLRTTDKPTIQQNQRVRKSPTLNAQHRAINPGHFHWQY